MRDGDIELGVTPIDARLPCGKHKLSIGRSRYLRALRTVDLVAGKPGEVTIKLQRPSYTLRITSEPSGAMIKVAGKRVGAAPCSVEVPGFKSVSIEAEKRGYTIMKQSIYAKRDNQPVRLKLTAEKRGKVPKKR